MYFCLEKLCKEIGNEREIVIYGAGHFALEIYDRLCAVGWKDRIKCFAVTSIGTHPEYIDAIPVVEFKDLLLKGICLLVAVGDAYIEEIRQKLNEYSLEHIVYLWEYRISKDKIRDVLLEGSFDALHQLALEEYIWKNPKYIKERKKLWTELETILYEHKNSEILDKSIVYVMEEETARNAKIIKALLERGYDITVIQYDRKRRYVAEKELLDQGIVLRRFDCLWEFIVESLKYRPLLYVHDIAWVRFEFACVAIRYKKIWGKTVVAPYETLIGSFTGISQEVLEDEKYCLENADAVVWRYFSKDYLHDKMGYRFQGDSVQLLDYCGGYKIPLQSVRISDEKLKLCYVVSQIDSFFRQDSMEYTQPTNFIDLLDKLDESCELHVFAWSASEDIKRQLNELQDRYPNFNYFLKVDHKDLIQRISTYDYGLCVYTSEKIPEYPIGAETIWGGFMCTEGTYRYSVSNRYFDYIDAELAVITTLPEKLCDYLSQFDVIIRMNSENLDLDYLKKNKAYYKEKAKVAKKELLMSKKISILTDMFERICANGDE